MNSLLGSIGNSLLAGSNGISGTSILLQAVGAAMRGESPQAFMKRLANQHPQLRKMNLDDLQGSAQQLAQQNGVDLNDLTKQIDSMVDPLVSNGGS